jgi:hypothetical protein
MLGIAAWATRNHTHELATEQPQVEAVSPHVVHAVAEMDAFFGHHGSFKAARNIDFDNLHKWAVVLQDNWPLLSPAAQDQLRKAPTTWHLIQQKWSSLTPEDRKILGEHWLPDLPKQQH